ncbi:MAG: putative DNA modification/repair radical SAM protein [Oscillospiraceae bacterium]|nr:putative DNA modification/repair radical SAM protein [Oscillospiraceae bacterium]
MTVYDKLKILAESAKYDVACTSSGSSRKGKEGGVGNTVSYGLCHSFAADGRCISLLKVLMTNHCINDCKYCGCRSSADMPRAAFTPEELAELTMSFYRRNYIEGLFLSSGIILSPDHTTQLMCRSIDLLRNKYGFNGYIHAKAIPGASPELISRLGALIDRISVNIELPSASSLSALAPQKTKESILAPMAQIRDSIDVGKKELQIYRHAEKFAPAGQSTQMIIGASPETDYRILKLSQGLYNKYKLRRVFYSAYIPVGDDRMLPSVGAPLLREHRLYQADWLLRFYGFSADEILSEEKPSLDVNLDPKCNWAINHLERFPIEINTADYETILRVPGIGVRSAKRIVAARRQAFLDFDGLKKLGVVLKRAKYFIICKGKSMPGMIFNEKHICSGLLDSPAGNSRGRFLPEQISLFDNEPEIRRLQNTPAKEAYLLEA